MLATPSLSWALVLFSSMEICYRVNGFVPFLPRSYPGKISQKWSLASTPPPTPSSPLQDAIFVSTVNPDAIRIRDELLQIANATNRGFSASKADRTRARDLIFDLARFNPTPEPLIPYYENATSAVTDGSPTLEGKWTLVYTDAPDIISLDIGGPLATAKLGRIGQECVPPLIKNVIEWRRPDWAKNLPFSGSDDSRVLQKVCTKGKASPNKPLLMELKLVGIDVIGMGAASTKRDNLGEAIQEDGIPAGLFEINPLELRGPLTAPFGQFEVLYLDEDLRIIKTGQNYLAVNARCEEEWF